MLDRILSHCGPEANDARAGLRQEVVRVLGGMSPAKKEASSQAVTTPMGIAESLYDGIQGLTPKDDAHRVMQSHALSLAVDLGNTR